MKMMLMLAVAAGLLGGCKPDAKTEARLAAVEKRQQNLRDDLIALGKHVGEVLAVTKEMSQSNAADMAQLHTNLVTLAEAALRTQEQLEESDRSLKALLAPRAPVVATRPVPAVNYGMRDGVPLAVYNQIAAKAVKEWPGDFNMQAYEIKNQVEAFRKLHP